MSKPALAPTPWLNEWSASISNNGSQHVYVVDANRKKIAAIWGKSAEKEATGLMMAAAPDMFEAITAYFAAKAELEVYEDDHPQDSGNQWNALFSRKLAAEDAMRAVLAKATGAA